ncbi:MAG: EamA family transporter, partial [Candidatus Nanohalobium sp.]
MEAFILFAAFAAVLFASASILSKHFLDLEIEDHVFTGAVFGWPFFLLFTALGLLKGTFFFKPAFSITMAAAGGLYSVILILYLKGLSEGEASRFIPTLAVNTIILAVLSFIFLGKTFTLGEYFGMFLTFAGATVLSLETSLKEIKLNSRKASGLALLTAFLIASRDLLMDFATASFSIWSGFLWMGIGGLATSLTVLTVSRKGKLGIENLKEHSKMIGVGGLRATGFLAYAVAISLGPAAKASAVLKLNSMLVFLGATTLAIVNPALLRKKQEGTSQHRNSWLQASSSSESCSSDRKGRRAGFEPASRPPQGRS